MRRSWIVLALCVFLTGCSALPRPREMENMVLLRTLGVDRQEEGYVLTASTGLLPQEEKTARILRGEGETVEAAAADLKQNSTGTVFLGYVEHILLGKDVEEPAPVLAFAGADGELSLGTALWQLPHHTAAEAVRSGGEMGVEQRLNTLRLNGAEVRTLERVWGELLDTGSCRIPALTLREGLLDPLGPLPCPGARKEGFREAYFQEPTESAALGGTAGPGGGVLPQSDPLRERQPLADRTAGGTGGPLAGMAVYARPKTGGS